MTTRHMRLTNSRHSLFQHSHTFVETTRRTKGMATRTSTILLNNLRSQRRPHRTFTSQTVSVTLQRHLKDYNRRHSFLSPNNSHIFGPTRIQNRNTMNCTKLTLSLHRSINKANRLQRPFQQSRATSFCVTRANNTRNVSRPRLIHSTSKLDFILRAITETSFSRTCINKRKRNGKPFGNSSGPYEDGTYSQ